MGIPIKRASNISSILYEEGLGFAASKLGMSRQNRQDQDDSEIADLPKRLRRVCERLGPVFIKFGQVLSLRKDLLPEEICDELAKLQAEVTPFDNKVAKQLIQDEIARPISEVFSRVTDVPIAAASLAQVYAGELLDGTEVVLKVRRPEAVDTVTSDTELLLFLSKQLHRLIPKYRAQQVHRVAEEFVHEARKELDFLNEADAARRFAEHLQDDELISIPKIYKDLSTSSLIVMEKLNGTRLDRVRNSDELAAIGVQADVLVDTLLRTVMEQTLVHGLIHADLHPGNIFILPHGRVGLIDFGMHGEVSQDLQATLVRIMMHRANNRHNECAEAVLEAYHPLNNADFGGFKDAIVTMGERLEKADLSDYSIGQALHDEGKYAAKFNFVAPAGVLLFGRALIVIEGIALRFTPSINLPKKLRPIIQTILLKRLNFERLSRKILSLLPEILQQWENAPKIFQHILAIERRFANADSIEEAIASLSNTSNAARRRQSNADFGPWLLACVMWILAGLTAVIKPSLDIPHFAGISWISIAFITASSILTVILVMRRL